MKPKKITAWHMSTNLDYRVWQNDENNYFVSTTKTIATKLLLNLFDEDTDNKMHYGLVREIWNIGKVKAAEYAKQIIDASMDGFLSAPVAAIAMSILTDQVGFLYPDEFLTERLVGKKRLQYWKECLEKYTVNYEEPAIYAIMNMWGNDNKELLVFIKDNHKIIDRIIKDCEY
ncbi:hypothetical protein [Sporomusa sphaeroides]|uniref:Uncharacterized protein n=1 Tax=Sporomusa sphaeroides DSM 2875 TaxID=1337886 RepID=A0A1U7MA41_9FIRM|nr:hypothetical protein [Sporomusa sphaeroides]OLS54337.1 hypothetical protein SPSPH_45830 [Sporomusa sphaeroides DSM 2875]CVK21566.1 hypothetical protein SSPH_04258 [Sporomusa sphaeroides DSM 2875]